MTRPPIHPGGVLADELGVGAAWLGRELYAPTKCLTQVLNAERAITADTALRLGPWVGTGPELRLAPRKQHELRLAEQQIGPEFRRTIATRAGASSPVGA